MSALLGMSMLLQTGLLSPAALADDGKTFEQSEQK
jgi:hypothetical protein